MLQDFFNVEKTPAMQKAAFLMAVLVLVLWAPFIFHTGQEYLLPFLQSQWGYKLGFPVSMLVWLIVFPILFFLMKGSLASSVGMGAMYLADKVGIY